MGWSAIIETDFGDRYTLIRPDGWFGGKALLAFLSILDSQCNLGHATDNSVAQWIVKFNEQSGYDFCETAGKLLHTYYGGDWDYEDDQYHIFRLREPGFEITEADFKKTIKEIREKWTNIADLIEDLQVLIGEFKKGYLEETDWYVEGDTIGDFEGLLQTLILAKERSAKRVRIRIE
ncbi:MAG: hypothetical protein ABIQ77_07525 [Anaerolineales bacterium]